MLIRRKEIKPIEFDELKIIDYTAGQDTISSFAEITVPAGIGHRLSWSNRSDKHYYIIKGNVTFTVNGESYDHFPGDVCIIPKGSRFRYSNTGSEEVKLILIHTPNFKLECEVFE